MSGRICRETYANYGSYLRSRGYDKAICDLIDMIESGKIPVGPLWPVDKCNAILNGTLEIIECDGNIPGPGTGGVQSGMGQLWVQGGYNGSSSGPALARDLSIQAANGINTGGAIIQKAPVNSTVVVPNVGQITNQNYFESNTILDGGLTMSDQKFLNPAPATGNGITVITDIVNSISAPPSAWTPALGFPNDYTLATTQAIHDYVANIAGVTHLSYNGNNNASPVPQVHLTNEVFKIKGDTISQSSSSPSPAIITQAQANQELIIDLTKTGVIATTGSVTGPSPAIATYGSTAAAAGGQHAATGPSSSYATNTVEVPRFTVDSNGRITGADNITTSIMTNFFVEANSNPASIAEIKNGNLLEFSAGDMAVTPPTYSDNLKVELASGVIEYKLNKNLKLNSLLLGGQNTAAPIVNEIVDSSTGIASSSSSASDQKLATEKAIVNYVSSQSGMTNWKLQADTPVGTSATITNGIIVKITGDSNNNIQTTRTSTSGPPASDDVVVELQNTLTKVNSITSENSQDLTLASNGSNTVINLTTGTATGSTGSQGVIINHALNIGGPSNPTTAAGGLSVAGSATIDGDATIAGDLAVTSDVTLSGKIKADGLQNISLSNTGSNTQFGVLMVRTTGSGTGPGLGTNTVDQYEIIAGNSVSQIASSLRYKENVEIMTEEAAADLMKIMPRTFNYKGSNDETFGLIAEELAGTQLKAAVANDNEGRPDSINYSMLVAPLLRIVQDQNERIKALEEKVEALSK